MLNKLLLSSVSYTGIYSLNVGENTEFDIYSRGFNSKMGDIKPRMFLNREIINFVQNFFDNTWNFNFRINLDSIDPRTLVGSTVKLYRSDIDKTLVLPYKYTEVFNSGDWTVSNDGAKQFLQDSDIGNQVKIIFEYIPPP